MVKSLTDISGSANYKYTATVADRSACEHEREYHC